MSSSLFANLDRSLSIVPRGQCGDYFLYSDGSVVSHRDSWTSRCVRSVPFIYDPTVTNLFRVFMECVDHWTALKNDQKFNRRTIAVEEFTQQIERICFIKEFVFASLGKIEADPANREKICALVSQLLEKQVFLPQSLQEISPEAFLGQLDFVTIWRMEEKSPPVLTPALLAIPAPKEEILNPDEPIPNILEIPAFYTTLIQRIENPTGNWMVRFKDWWNNSYVAEQNALDAMCKEALEAKDPALKYVDESTKLSLGKLLALFKTGRVPDLQILLTLKELIIAADLCKGDRATVSEEQGLALTGKTVTAQDKALNWKSEFVTQQLKLFFLIYYTSTEDAQNVHLMNTLLYHYGERLGMSHLKAPSCDIHVVKKATSLPYQWPDVLRYLTQKWDESSVESLKTYSDLNKWQSDIGKYLEERVKQTIPSIQDPQAFVLAEYFDEKGLLNDRGAIRFLKETLVPISQIAQG
jgi:hypothetical protein